MGNTKLGDACDDQAALVSENIRAVCGDRYQIESQLGAGSFGEVYKAVDTVLNRTVALKKIRQDYFSSSAETDDLRLRFLREAQVAARLQHPNIVTIFDIISSPDLSLIVMELIDGSTLDDKLRSERSLPVSETVRILSRVADALDHAHSQKVVHRDIKPANILLSRSGLVKVTDFGTAKADTSADLTVVGRIIGTPDYMSPEQAQGEPLDGRSDLFSLGCVLYECLAGEKPFRSSNVTGILLRIVSDDPSPIDCEKLFLDREVDSMLRRALAKEPGKRFQTAVDFGRALNELKEYESPRKEPSVSAEAESRVQGDSQVPPSEARDSVADVLMKEARHSTEIQSFLIALRNEKRRLGSTVSSMLEFRNVSLTPEEAYILSRVDGRITPIDIFSLSPLSESDTARALLGFLRTGLVTFDDPEKEITQTETKEEPTTVETPEKEEAEAPRAPGEHLERSEVEKMYELSQSQDDWQVLAIEPTAGYEEVKRAFQKKAFRLHPDRYASIQDEAFQKKLSRLFTRVSDAFAALSARNERGEPTRPKPERPPAAKQTANDPSSSATSSMPAWHDPQQARELYEQARVAFKQEDYWRTIELCQKAIEIDQSRADYFYLLGSALSQNPKWRHDAEKNLRMAAELDPSRPELFVALGELYRSEGLDSRARRAFDKAKAIDPDYSVPDGV